MNKSDEDTPQTSSLFCALDIPKTERGGVTILLSVIPASSIYGR